jgi:adenosine deaminase
MVDDVFDLAPKVELHIHLEGAIPLETMWSLISRHGGDPAVPDRTELVRRLVYRDFPHFIDAWTWMTGFLRTPDDFTTLADAVATSLAAQHILYAEASISPTDYVRHGASVEEIVLAVRSGIDRVATTTVNLNVDLVRDTGPQRAMRTLEAVIDVAHDAGVGGITIGGSEHDHPPGPFAPVYRRAREAGLRLTAHAGEAAGPEGVWSAIRDLGVERIGHGIRSVEDPDLVAHLVEHQIPLEVCPTSNLRTGVAADWASHPVHALLAAGANVTISTDDPTYFECDLAGELRKIERTGAATAEGLTLAAIDASWLEPDDAAALRSTVVAFWASHRGRPVPQPLDLAGGAD